MLSTIGTHFPPPPSPLGIPGSAPTSPIISDYLKTPVTEINPLKMLVEIVVLIVVCFFAIILLLSLVAPSDFSSSIFSYENLDVTVINALEHTSRILQAKAPDLNTAFIEHLTKGLGTNLVHTAIPFLILMQKVEEKIDSLDAALPDSFGKFTDIFDKLYDDIHKLSMQPKEAIQELITLFVIDLTLDELESATPTLEPSANQENPMIGLLTERLDNATQRKKELEKKRVFLSPEESEELNGKPGSHAVMRIDSLADKIKKLNVQLERLKISPVTSQNSRENAICKILNQKREAIPQEIKNLKTTFFEGKLGIFLSNRTLLNRINDAIRAKSNNPTNTLNPNPWNTYFPTIN